MSPVASEAAHSALGRPRDARIDRAVLRATVELLEEVGYLRLTVAAIAERAGTNKPAIYRRWPTKAHLVHEAVFPIEGRSDSAPLGEDLRDDIRALLAIGLQLLSQPATRAALPGLMAEMYGDPSGTATLLGQIGPGTWGWLQGRIDDGIEAGDVRAEVQSSTVLELIAGSTFVATAVRPADELGSAWIEQVADLIMAGIRS